MEKNVGGWDRRVRLVLGPLLILLGIAGYAGFALVAFGPFPQALTAIVLFLVGGVLLWTGVTQKCHVNDWLDRNTYRSMQDRAERVRQSQNRY